MRTISFKVSDDEATRIRRMANEEGLNLSEFLRRRVVAGSDAGADPIPRVRCEFTGAEIFGTNSALPPLTTESVHESLADFP